MLDFVNIKSKIDDKKKTISVYPGFLVKHSKDLMIKGKTFYAIWDDDVGLWSLDERRACELIDREIDIRVHELQEKKPDYDIHAMKLLDYKSRQYTEWQSYCRAIPDEFIPLDTNVTFLNDSVGKEDYRSHKLAYPFDECDIDGYNELISTLYDEDERQKIEWAIGSIISGDSKEIQKFYVFYGEPGSGKSTMLNIIRRLFAGYCTTFDARAIGNANAVFALEPFKDNPLIAIQDDGDLMHIEDNTRLNSIASHENLVINEKHKSTYAARFNTVMFMGTNKPVRITDAKSGVIRRLIDINPSGHTLPRRKYDAIMNHIDFELPGIAYHCYEVYKTLGKRYYDTYKPMNMIGITNDFYNFIADNLDFFIEHKDRLQRKRAWQLYKDYVQESNIQYPFTLKAFKEELKNYYNEYFDRSGGERQVYCDFKEDMFNYEFKHEDEADEPLSLSFDETESLFDKLYYDQPAQYANKDGKPLKKWEEVTTKLSDLDSHELHYILMPEEHIVIDFDLKDENGNKSFERNLEAASKWPPTYAELSKSGEGIHLHYIYTGDPSKLSRIYAEDIEVKVFTGKSSLRRKLTKCNNLPIAKISSGLPLKGEKPMVNLEAMKNEKQLRALIRNCLLKKHHGATKPEVDYIYSTLEKCYESGMHYDVTDMRPDITAFANNSTNQALACLKLVSKMKFKSEEPSENVEPGEAPIIFFDCEVFPNLFIICWKFENEDKVFRMINPTPSEVEDLFKYRMIGFNCRRYDNHILYARSVGYSEEEIFELSSRIVSSDKKDENRNCYFGEAYNLSYADIYDFATKKQSLKKWEIELGIHHQENAYPWDQPLDKEHWEEVAEYCENDVRATEALFKHCHADFAARKILSELTGLSVNATNRQHIIKLLVGNERNPQLVYTNLKTGERSDGTKMKYCFPDYEFVRGEDNKMHNMMWGTDLGFGGYVYAEPGMYTNVALLDVNNMHGESIGLLNKFSDYTQNYRDLRQARIAIKHRDYKKLEKMFDGKFMKYVQTDEDADNLQNAIKLVLNSTYGIAAATFDNPIRDKRDVNNTIALLGALFMRTLQKEVTDRGFTVAHIKTDSIKIPNATPEIISFVQDFAKKYGYEMEHEATYTKMCLVNDAVYIAKYDDKGVRNKGGKHANEWTATGAEFQHPYILKTLFSHKPLEFKDFCETKSVAKGELYLDLNEALPEDEHNYRFVGKVGEFVPIKPGEGGGLLYRYSDGKYYAAAGTKDYRWLESEIVKNAGYESKIDELYFKKLADDAIEHISEFGDYEWFVSDDVDPANNISDNAPEEVPWDEVDKFTAMNPPIKKGDK